MEYNTQREKLMFSDYGRNVYKLIDYVKRIESREDRTKAANTVVSIMAQVCPKAREGANWHLKLWEHLMIMSNWELDVDVPEGVSRHASMMYKPDKIKYNEGRIHFRHYGRFLEEMIRKVVDMPEGEEKSELIREIAHTMKRQYLIWNRDTVNDNLIRDQLARLSGGKIVLDDSFQFMETKKILADENRLPVMKKKRRR